MDWITSIPDLLSLLFGGSIISIVTWRFARQRAAAEALRAEAEAKQAQADARKAEAEALLEKQNYYQQMAEDIAKDRDYYKQDRDEQREKLDKLTRSVADWKQQTDLTIDELRKQVARNGRQLEVMRPLICADMTCELRKRIKVADDDSLLQARQRPANKEPSAIEPISSDAM